MRLGLGLHLGFEAGTGDARPETIPQIYLLNLRILPVSTLGPKPHVRFRLEDALG